MPKSYWSYAFATATYLINRLPTPTLLMKSPLQKLFGTDPNYTKLRVYGCLCFPWLRPYNANKLEDRSTPCVFIGYSPTQSTYLCLQPSIGRIYTSRHVKFDETIFPFKSPLPQKPETTNSPPIQNPHVTKIPLQQPLVQLLPSPSGSPSSAPHRKLLRRNRHQIRQIGIPQR